MGFAGSATGLFPVFSSLPRIGLRNVFRTLLKPDPRRPLRTCGTVGGGAWTCKECDLLATLGSDRLLPNMTWFSCTSKESLSNWSSSVLCSSPNLLRKTDISSMLLFSLAEPIFLSCSKVVLFIIISKVAAKRQQNRLPTAWTSQSFKALAVNREKSSPAPSYLWGSGAKKSDSKPGSPAKLDPKLLKKTDSDQHLFKRKNSGNNSSLALNLKNEKTMEDNEEKKKNIDSENNPNSKDAEKGAEAKEDKNSNKKKTHRDESDSKSGIAETCVGVGDSCKDGNSLTACVKGVGTVQRIGCSGP